MFWIKNQNSIDFRREIDFDRVAWNYFKEQILKPKSKKEIK